MPDKPPAPPSAQDSRARREAKLAAALRGNLKRRKAAPIKPPADAAEKD